MGRLVMAIGVGIVVVGAVLHFAPWLLNWFGKLPGDIRFEGERTKVFLPITSMIVISLVVSLLLNIFRR
ncbi:DUF2905 domain-containing protein [Desulfohalobium retbaense]|uniref:DUF2905 domain-containing protein n=1 Tax=Desulfohalobium retbaense (strain ATCC 49708 / DSM 5692 / JCM 16813 / HR100) TaxID=485915 RepID=C8X3B7_DESRD|nr:DUF2905 domain-containing protein [Desulfohalobium retbaense]ACV68914.1 conserved hypothetical protein [Desulfohalobium retbaense DSM 5692]